MDKVMMIPPFGIGEPKEVEATPEKLVPMMVAGWTQCEPPTKHEEVNINVND